MYFAFTTLSTVGFGDFYPVSSFERIMGVIIMLVGVLIFSYIMNIFIDIINIFLELWKEYEESEKLFAFFSVFKFFNRNRTLPDELI